MNISLGQLIRLEVINTAKLMLMDREIIIHVSHRLKYEESNHFLRFFKPYSGMTPSEFKIIF